MSGCIEKIFDREHEVENRKIWEEYGSELAADFGTVPCGKLILYNNRCKEHAKNRRSGNERRNSSDGRASHL